VHDEGVNNFAIPIKNINLHVEVRWSIIMNPSISYNSAGGQLTFNYYLGFIIRKYNWCSLL